MEDMVMVDRLQDPHSWAGRSVLLTGHTGFKGGWLATWLAALGADVHGLALEPSTTPSFFEVAGVATCLASDRRGDIEDFDVVDEAVQAAEPQVVFHLAAQPLVRDGYRDPLGTWRTNVMGTAHLLEALRRSSSVEAVVVVTTDKVYRNREWLFPYRESDQLGGHDPYSASKSGTELVAASFRTSFFAAAGGRQPAIVTARAGNVIGGGDWSAERLVPDVLRAMDAGAPILLRYPQASRPWQHVLDPLAGYLSLAERLVGPRGADLPTTWNFGPDPSSVVPVIDLVDVLCDSAGKHVTVVAEVDGSSPEAQLLALDSSQARALLGWRPRWDLREAVSQTIEWHEAWRDGQNMRDVTLRQIDSFAASAEGTQ